jgi:hypothetical protein
MVRFLLDEASDRKFRLFACACFDMLKRPGWYLELDPEIEKVVELARRFADGAATARERTTALRSAKKWGSAIDDFSLAARQVVEKDAWRSALSVLNTIANDLSWMGYHHEREELLVQANTAIAAVVRECFGSLHLRPVNFDPAWRTSDVLALANGIYEQNAFDRMPILADAFQDAGCDCDDVLSHLRDPDQQHYRGCWVLDLVLDKS